MSKRTFIKRIMVESVCGMLCVVLFLYLFTPLGLEAKEKEYPTANEGMIEQCRELKKYNADKKLYKKLKKNAWSVEPNEKSKELTLGYALAKIKAQVEADENAYLCFAGKKPSEEIKGLKYKGGTKTQRRALKWGVDVQYLATSYWGGNDWVYIKEFDADVKLTRWELVDMLSKMTQNYYTDRVPFLFWGDPDKAIKWEGSTYTETTTKYAMDSIWQCIVVPCAEAYDYKNGLYLDLDATATREDLVRALKNLKLITSSKYTAKIVYRTTPLTSYGKKDGDSEYKKRLQPVIKENGLYEWEILKGEEYFHCKFKTDYSAQDPKIVNGFSISYEPWDSEKVFWAYSFEFPHTKGAREAFPECDPTCGFAGFMDPLVVDPVGTIAEIFKIRG